MSNFKNRFRKCVISSRSFKKNCARKIDTIKHYYYDFTHKEKIFHYASSLSFYSIFSIIPVFLMIFSILSGFASFQGQIQNLKQTILNNILPDNANEVSTIIDSFLSNGREMGFFGFFVSLISSFIFFRNFDDISARIFLAKKRSFFDSFIIYWLLVTLIPLFIAASIYFSGIFSDKYGDMSGKIHILAPMLTTWFAFGILLRIAANKSIAFWNLALSSLMGSLMWHFVRSLFFYYMSYNEFYSNIYGSISIVMFAFLWIYISWLVILVSMSICKKIDTALEKKDNT